MTVQAYAWTKTDACSYEGETTAFSWIDARSGHRLSLSGDDEISVYGYLPFPLMFYGEEYIYVIISTNGLAGFDVVGADSWNNSPIPYANPPNNIICPFWDDLAVDPGKGCAIYVYHETTPDVFVIQWDHVTDAATKTADLTFQVQFHRSPARILFMYRSMKGIIADGSSATIGIENRDGTIGIRYRDTYDAGPVYDELALEFNPITRIPVTHTPGILVIFMCLHACIAWTLTHRYVI